MRRIATIVEGRGEVAAVPVLLRRIAAETCPGKHVVIPRPWRVKRHGVLKPGELERYVRLAAADAGANGGILILLDADDECPVGLAEEILRRALTERGDLRIRVVLAKTEYESWFLAAGVLGNPPAAEAEPPFDPEAIRNAKGKLSALLPDGRSYRPTIHQVRLTATLDLDTARSAPSFDKLWRDVVALLASPEARSTE